MTKMLNLDDIAATKRSVTLRGKEYVVKDMTVEMFVEATAAAKKMDAENKEISVGDQMQATVETIQRHIPDLPADVLKELSIDQIVLLARFIRGDDLSTAGAAEKAVEGDEAKKA